MPMIRCEAAPGRMNAPLDDGRWLDFRTFDSLIGGIYGFRRPASAARGEDARGRFYACFDRHFTISSILLRFAFAEALSACRMRC